MEPWDDYDIHDEKSVLRHAAKLTNNTLRGILGEYSIEIVGGTNSKGRFGQIVEEEYFRIDNNSRREADFSDLGIELKTHPMVRKNKGLVAKERLVLSIINYMEADEMDFDTFSEKNSRLMLVFYMWVPETSVFDYSFLKVVDWSPSPAELQMIHEDWDVIHSFIHEGKAHLLSERHTKVLAANTKGEGHGRDLRRQPHSAIPAKQRSLSFKASFMTALYHSNPDVGEVFIEKDVERYEPVFNGPWIEGIDFESAVLSRFQRFVGMTCQGIEEALGIDLNPASKQYYRILCNNMMGTRGRRDVKELMEAGISMKTIRIRTDGKPKESMSFPYFKYEDIVKEEWEDSEFISQIDCRFLFPIFGFRTDDPSNEKDRKALVFKGAFFWALPEREFDMAREVWEDTKRKTIEGCMDGYIPLSGHPVFHVRTHGRNRSDTCPYRGREYTKKGFWINDSYLKDVVAQELYGPHSTRMP